VTLAISKKRKNELVDQYKDWAQRSEGLILTEYTGMTMKQIDELRKKIRESGGEFHIVKNTLTQVAFDSMQMPVPEGLLEGSTAVVFAFQDVPALAKAVTEYGKTVEFVKIKAGYLNGKAITSDEVRALSELPPLPVVRAQLLGTILAPASKLVRTLAEPGRSLAAVINAYAEKDAAAVEAAA
jgi:large subunit ribosomal protein L10